MLSKSETVDTEYTVRLSESNQRIYKSSLSTSTNLAGLTGT